MLFKVRSVIVAVFFATVALGANNPTTSTSNQERVYAQRAEKIVTSLRIPDAGQAARVRAIIMTQYSDLNRIHSARDAQIKTAKEVSPPDKNTTAAPIAEARANAESAQDRLRVDYLSRLSTELTPSQIDQVKDGMTYGVLPLTYRVYQEMLPNLTTEQKARILTWLTEAREHAMSGSTSEEKHAWFGRYKGKINNYLAAAGIDIKKAEKEMTQRKKAPATK